MYGSFGGDPAQFATGTQFGGGCFARIEDSGSKPSDRSAGGGGQTRRPLRKPATPYETCLRKYVQYLQQGKLERAGLLISQGQQIFPSDEARKHFKFNSGVYSLARGRYGKAAEKYLDIYEEYGRHVTVRPAARRVAATAPAESEKFAILQNLIIACLLREARRPSRGGMAELHDILRAENLLNVRYTQDADELNLFKLAAYVRQYIAHHQRPPRLVGEDGQDLGTPSGADGAYSEGSAREYEASTARGSAGDSLAAAKPASQGTEEATPTESDLVPYDEAASEPIDFSGHFKKSTLGQRVVRTLVHPLCTKEAKLAFLNKHVPVDSWLRAGSAMEAGEASPRSPRAAERARKAKEGQKRIAYEQKVGAGKENRRARMKTIIKKVDETAREREAKQQSIQRQRERLRRRQEGLVTQTSKAGPVATIITTAEHTLRGSAGTEGKLDSREARSRAVPLSETDSIFDQALAEQEAAQADGTKDQPLGPGPAGGSQLFTASAGTWSGAVSDAEEQDPQSGDDSEEAKTLGVDLSALYSHKKPGAVLASQKRLIMRIMRMQDASKRREGKYRGIQIKRVERRKENRAHEAEYQKRLQEVDERILLMQEIEVDLIRYGGGRGRLDPVQAQYQALTTSIRNLCTDPNIAETILDHLRTSYDSICQRKLGHDPETGQEPYSAALEVILWSTRHILAMDDLDLDATEKAYLIAKINQVKEMFEAELDNPKLIISRNKRADTEQPFKKPKTPIERAAKEQ